MSRIKVLVVMAVVVSAVVVGAAALRLDWFEPTPERSDAPFTFRDDFDDVSSLEELFPADGSRWHQLQIESGEAPTANRVELTSDNRQSGTQALKMTAAPYDGRTVSKADITLGNLHFVKGDDVWFGGWFFLVGNGDSSDVFLWDLETTGKRGSPGRRLFLQADGSLASDLGKWHSGDTFRPAPDAATPFPVDRWVHLEVHLFLSDGGDGRLRVWQDGTLVLDGTGQTLPTAKTVYDRLQVGITANANRSHAQTLYVDDVVLSNRPPASP